MKGDPYNSFKFPVSLSGEGCWDQRQASKVPSFGLSAHCQSAVVFRGTSLLGMKCPDEKRQSSQSTRISRCRFFWWVEPRKVVTDIAIIICHQKLWDSTVLDVKTTQDETST